MKLEKPVEANDIPEGYLAPDALSGLPADTPLLIGYSGGVDSSVLLYLAHRYAKETGASLHILHLHHGIRGDEADRDAEFCRDVANTYGIPITVIQRDVPTMARENGESIETAARRARYEAFSDVMRTHRIPLLLTAHNADDQFETILFRLLRGSDASGLCGIPQARPIDGGTVLRPLLSVSRSEIERYAEAHAIPFVKDSTNDDSAYTRNLLRNEVLPLLRKITPTPEHAAARTAAALRRDKEFFDARIEEILARAETPDGLAREALAGLPDALLSRTLLAYWKRTVPLDTYESVHVELLCSLLRNGKTGTRLSLPKSTAELCYRTVRIFPAKEPAVIDPEAHPIALGITPLPVPGSSLLCTHITAENPNATHKITEKVQNIYNSATQIYLQFDTIIGRLGTASFAVRPRRPGDRIFFKGMHRSLRTLLNAAHISTEDRQSIVVVTLDDEPIWIPGIAVRDGIPTDPRQAPVPSVCLSLCPDSI